MISCLEHFASILLALGYYTLRYLLAEMLLVSLFGQQKTPLIKQAILKQTANAKVKNYYVVKAFPLGWIMSSLRAVA